MLPSNIFPLASILMALSFSATTSAQIAYPTSTPAGTTPFVSGQGTQTMMAQAGSSTGPGQVALYNATAVSPITSPSSIALSYSLGTPLPAGVFDVGVLWLPLSCAASISATLQGTLDYSILGDTSNIVFHAGKFMHHETTATSSSQVEGAGMIANPFTWEYETSPNASYLNYNVPFQIQGNGSSSRVVTVNATVTRSVGGTGSGPGGTSLQWGIFADRDLDGRPDAGSAIHGGTAFPMSSSGGQYNMKNGQYVLVLRYDSSSKLDSYYQICTTEDPLTQAETMTVIDSADLTMNVQ